MDLEAQLFRPGPPLKNLPPTDYPIEKRRTHNISGIAFLLQSGQLKSYQQSYEPSEQGHLNALRQAEMEVQHKRERLAEATREWNPQEDPHSLNTDPSKTLFVGRLPYSARELDLVQVFSKYGEIERIRIVRDRNDNSPRGYAFVLFRDALSVRTAIRETGTHRGVMIHNRSCVVDIERGRAAGYFRPRRLGGGLGGRHYTKAPTSGPQKIAKPRTILQQRPTSMSMPHHIPTRYNVSRQPAKSYRQPYNTSFSTTASQDMHKTSYRPRQYRSRNARDTQQNPDY